MLVKSKQLSLNAIESIKRDKEAVRQSLIGDKGLSGKDGESGAQGMPGTKGFSGSQGESGRDGARGPMGPQGPKGDRGEAIKGKEGEAGQEGRGISDIKILGGRLTIIYTDGSRENLGQIIGPPGQPGLRGRTGSAFTGADTGFPWYNIPFAKTVEVAINRQHLISGDMTIEGEFVVKGEAVVI